MGEIIFYYYVNRKKNKKGANFLSVPKSCHIVTLFYIFT